MHKLLIIDGNSLIYRAYYALPFLSNSSGQYTGGVYGFLNMFLKVLEEYKPTHVVIAFDHSHITFRNQIFKDYKGTRKPMPNELRTQLPILKEILASMNITCIEQDGIEADDIIGTIAKCNNCETVILSGDRDVLQLIDKTTSVWLTKKGISEIVKMDEETLLAEQSIIPAQIIEMKALMGDTSDNIPGVSGIGEKTAKALVTTFGDIESLYANIDSGFIKKNIRDKLIEYKETAYMSKALATIKTDCSLDYSFESLTYSLPFNADCVALLKKYEINSILKKKGFFVGVDNIAKKNLIQRKIVEVETQQELERILGGEYTQIGFYFDENEKICFSIDEVTTYTIKTEISLFSILLGTENALKKMKPVLEDKKISKIVCDIKKLMHILPRYGIEIQGEVTDLKLATYLIGTNLYSSDETAEYFEKQREFLKALEDNSLMRLYDEIEKPLINVLYEMEQTGFVIDANEVFRLSAIYDKELESLTHKIYELAGEEFNINSPRTVSQILFDKLSLTPPDNKKSSTNFEVLSHLEDEHEIVPYIIRYRRIQKLKTTYLDAFKTIISQKGNVVHTIFNQMHTATGRLSSSEPNLQNIPVRNDEGKALRKMFISRFDGGEIISADYNQIELRLLAHFSEDEKLIEGFNVNKDIHKLTASQIFGIREEDVTPKQRRDAKAVNFGIIYGISEFGLSNNVGISRRSAKDYIDKYFEQYPKVKEYMNKNVEKARRYGHATTLFRRIRKIPEINSNIYQKRMFGERVAMNMPLQGSASDIIKLAMVKVQRKFKEANLKSKLVLQIHDELIVDAHPSEINKVKEILKICMQNVVTLKVPLMVEINSGKTWFDA